MGMDDASERFDGNVLSLVTEQNFERMFHYDLPFGKDIGWYPDCRFTGFFEECPIRWKGPIVLHFFNAKCKILTPLSNAGAFLLASYLLPLLAKVSSVENLNALSGGAERRKATPKSESVFAGSSRVLTERSAR